MSSTIEVTILGQRYRLKTDSDPRVAEAAARLVGQQIADLQKEGVVVATHNLAILAAINIAADLMNERRQNRELRERVNSQLLLLKSSLQWGIEHLGPAQTDSETPPPLAAAG